jgi:hypothetical protein
MEDLAGPAGFRHLLEEPQRVVGLPADWLALSAEFLSRISLRSIAAPRLLPRREVQPGGVCAVIFLQTQKSSPAAAHSNIKGSQF